MHDRCQLCHERAKFPLVQLGHDGVEGGSRIGGLRDGAADDDVRCAVFKGLLGRGDTGLIAQALPAGRTPGVTI